MSATNRGADHVSDLLEILEAFGFIVPDGVEGQDPFYLTTVAVTLAANYARPGIERHNQAVTLADCPDECPTSHTVSAVVTEDGITFGKPHAD